MNTKPIHRFLNGVPRLEENDDAGAQPPSTPRPPLGCAAASDVACRRPRWIGGRERWSSRWGVGALALLWLMAVGARGVGFVDGRLYVGEADREAVVTLYRGSSGPDPISVRYQTEDGIALAGRDYEPVSGVLVFGLGESQQTIHVPILNNAVRNSDRTFRIRLFDPSPGAEIESSPLLIVVIVDNERGYEVQSVTDMPDENSGEMRMAILRTGDFEVSSMVSYRVIAGRDPSYAAVPGRDFTPVSGVATFAPGETRWSFSVPILDDPVADGPRQILVELFDPVGGVPIGGARATEWTLYDDELGFGPGDPLDEGHGWIMVPEREGPLVVRIARQGDFDISSSVDYEVVAAAFEYGFATAESGRDFEPARGTLIFEPGQTEADFEVFLHSDHASNGDKRLEVRLSNPSDGVPIERSHWVLLIRDAEWVPVRVDPGFVPVAVVGPVSGAFTFIDRPAVPQSAGGLLAAMDAAYLGLPGDLAVVRLLADGALDSGFQPFASITAWSATPDGVCHVLTEDARVLRLTAAGLPDPGFSYAVPPGHWIEALLSRADGGAWILEHDNENHHIPRKLGANGQPDSAFVGPRFYASLFRRMLATPSGGIALCGRGTEATGGEILEGLAVCGADGTRVRSGDPTQVAAEVVQAIALPDGRFLAVGYLTDIEGFAFFRATPSGGVDPSLPPVLGKFVLEAAGGRVWLLEMNPSTGRHRIQRRRWDGAPDPSWSAQTVEVDLRSSWQVWGGGGCGVCDWCWLINPYDWDEDLATLTGDGQGRLYLGSVVRVNGHLRRGLVLLDLDTPTDRLEISPGDARLGEDAGSTTVALVRSGDVSARGSYGWRTAEDSARAGIDYQPAAGVVEFAPGERSAVLPLVLIDNNRLDGDRVVRIEIVDAAGRPLPPVVVTVVNDDLGFLPGGIVASKERPWRLGATGHLVRRGHSGGANVIGSAALSRLRGGQQVGWADAFLPETLIYPVEDRVYFLSLQAEADLGR